MVTYSWCRHGQYATVSGHTTGVKIYTTGVKSHTTGFKSHNTGVKSHATGGSCHITAVKSYTATVKMSALPWLTTAPLHKHKQQCSSNRCLAMQMNWPTTLHLNPKPCLITVAVIPILSVLLQLYKSACLTISESESLLYVIHQCKPGLIIVCCDWL